MCRYVICHTYLDSVRILLVIIFNSKFTPLEQLLIYFYYLAKSRIFFYNVIATYFCSVIINFIAHINT